MSHSCHPPPPFSQLPCFSVCFSPLFLLSSVVVLVGALRHLVFFLCLLALLCAYVVVGVLAGWLCCVRVVHVFSLCCLASSSRGASAHEHHVAFFLLRCPLSSCPQIAHGCMRVRLCATCACARLCCGGGGWALCYFIIGL